MKAITTTVPDDIARPVNWTKSGKLNMVFFIHNNSWLKKHKPTIDAWLKDEGRGNFTESKFSTVTLFLYTKEQETYFMLRWPA